MLSVSVLGPVAGRCLCVVPIEEVRGGVVREDASLPCKYQVHACDSGCGLGCVGHRGHLQALFDELNEGRESEDEAAWKQARSQIPELIMMKR